MITAIVRFKLRPGLTRDQAMAEVRHTIPLYQSQPALIRKAIHLDVARGEGFSVYLWRERAAAEAFFAMARPILLQQTGAEPQISLHDVDVLVDNLTGEVVEPDAA